MALSSTVLDSVFFALVFIILGSPLTYALVNRVVGEPILRQKLVENGVPTRLGLVIHALVFGLAHYFFSKK